RMLEPTLVGQPSTAEATWVGARYGVRGEFYDIASALATAFRRRAVDLLALSPGEVVLDVGWGTGLCFPLIEERIGDAGWVVGLDVSAAMMRTARTRVERRGWSH